MGAQSRESVNATIGLSPRVLVFGQLPRVAQSLKESLDWDRKTASQLWKVTHRISPDMQNRLEIGKNYAADYAAAFSCRKRTALLSEIS